MPIFAPGDVIRKFLIILGIVMSYALFTVVTWPFETRLSEADVQRVKALVQQQTSEPILSIGPLTRWRVHVDTGVKPAPPRS